MSRESILVTGATGTIGSDVVEILADTDASVRAMTRSPESVPWSEELYCRLYLREDIPHPGGPRHCSRAYSRQYQQANLSTDRLCEVLELCFPTVCGATSRNTT
jgi:nucleoside-diphosphate-sugar epimerase